MMERAKVQRCRVGILSECKQSTEIFDAADNVDEFPSSGVRTQLQRSCACK